MQQEFEAIVVGQGPAGMAAAVGLAEHGVQTAVVNDQPQTGGQVYRQLPMQFQWVKGTHGDIRPHKARELAERLNRIGDRITFFNETTVFGTFKPNEISVYQSDRVFDLKFKKLIICEGASERVIPFPGWNKPRIMTAGGMQRFIKQQGILPGKQIVVAGTGPLLFSLSAGLIEAGAERVTLCEASPLGKTLRFTKAIMANRTVLWETIGSIPQLLSSKFKFMQPYGIIKALGAENIQGVLVARLDRNGSPLPGTERKIKAETVALNHGFLPLVRLSRLLGCEHRFVRDRGYWEPDTDLNQRTSRKHIYAAGDGAGIGGAEMAMIEGWIAGLSVAVALGRGYSSGVDSMLQVLIKKSVKLNGYAAQMFKSFPIPWGLLEAIDRETIICRCESVKAGRIWDAMEAGAIDLTELKANRVALGPCQGRTCESIISMMMQKNGIRPSEHGQLSLRPPLSPLPINTLGAG